MESIFHSIQNISFFSTVFYGNTVLNYIIFIGLFLIILCLIRPVIKIILKLFNKIVIHTPTDSDDKLIKYFTKKQNHSLFPLEFSIAFFTAIRVLTLSLEVQKIVDGLAIIIITIFLVTTVIDIIKYLFRNRYSENNDPRANTLLLIFPIIKIFIWVLALLFIISNLGYDVTQILAGLGIGGVAIALASQSFLGDLIAFLSIASDKPFEIGDYILINNIEGTVKKIGIKSVRIERNMGEEVVIPNSKITSSDLHNFKRLNKRRFDITLNIDSNTPNEKLQLIPKITNELCNQNALLNFVRCSLTNLVNGTYEFTFVAYVLDKDSNIFFREKENYIYKLRQELDNNEIFFAMPTMVIKH